MQNKEVVQKLIQFAEMDSSTAIFLHENMYPMPLEIICYHCQQAAEKAIKALILAKGGNLTKTHDLGLLMESVSTNLICSENVLNACDDLTPFGVKFRYPQEISIDETLTHKAIANMNSIVSFCKEQLNEL